jgi:hypothetical protein
MPDTGAPWNIPYVESTDLVSDWPADSLALANAVAAGLSAAGNAGIGSNVVQATTRTEFSTTSSTFVTVTGLSVTITPSSATSKVLVIATTNMQDDNTTTGWQGRIEGGNIPADFFWNGRVLGENVGDFTASMLIAAPMMYLDSPATTSATTYSVQVLGVSGALIRVNKARNMPAGGRSTLIAIEVAA